MMFLFKTSGWLGQNLTRKLTDQSKLFYLLTIIYFDWDRTSKTDLRKYDVNVQNSRGT